MNENNKNKAEKGEWRKICRDTTQFVYLIIITFIPKLDSNIIRRNVQTNLSHEYRRERSWTKFYTLNHTKRNLSNITRALW